MRINWKYIQLLILVGLMVFLYSFSDNRNKNRAYGKTEIAYTNPEHIFIAPDTVNNLLIVNTGKGGKQVWDSLDLSVIEQRVSANPMVADAEVYKTINKDFGILIKQREPLARAMSPKGFYLDKDGGIMPLSPIYTARVPLLFNVSAADCKELYPLLKEVEKDQFLKRNIIYIKKEESGHFLLGIRKYPLKIDVGNTEDIDRKFENLKSFYKIAQRDSLFGKYKRIDLRFKNQVIGIK